MRRIVGVGGWLALAPMVTVAAARVAGLEDRSAVFFAVVTLTPLIFLPAYAVAAVAIACRLRALAGVALLLVLAHVVWVWPDLPWPGGDDHDGPGREARRLTVLAVNIRGNNLRMDDAAAAVRSAAEGADIVVVTELTPSANEALRRGGALDRFPHRREHVRTNLFGSGIYSRHPITRDGLVDVAGLPTTAVSIRLDDRRVDVVAVHTLQPLAGLRQLRAGLADLADFARRRPDTDRPLVMAGDFNATRHHRDFRRLLDRSGLVDAHLEDGRGFARSWPVGRGPVPPFALLDHVLVSPDITVVGTGERTIAGSDHRAVVAEVELR